MTVRESHFPILEASRESESFPIPNGVTRDPCGLCGKPIAESEEAIMYQKLKADVPKMAHAECWGADMQALVRVVGKYSVRSLRAFR